jgi:hypothetical protein
VAKAEGLTGGRGSLFLFGSSSVNDSLGRLITDDLQHLGFVVTRHGYAAAGLSRPDFRDLREALASLPIERDVSSVVFYVGANDAQSLWLRPEERAGTRAAWVTWDDDRWGAIYESRVVEMLDSVCARGAKHAILMGPVDVSNQEWQAKLERIRQLQARAAERSRCGHFVPTAGDIGHFRSATQPLRADDGLHMTHSGAHRVWQRVRSQILPLLDKESRSVGLGNVASVAGAKGAEHGALPEPMPRYGRLICLQR